MHGFSSCALLQKLARYRSWSLQPMLFLLEVLRKLIHYLINMWIDLYSMHQSQNVEMKGLGKDQHSCIPRYLLLLPGERHNDWLDSTLEAESPFQGSSSLWTISYSFCRSKPTSCKEIKVLEFGDNLVTTITCSFHGFFPSWSLCLYFPTAFRQISLSDC
jgi:hypothetical protein